MSVCGLVRCQSRSITFVLPLSAADRDPPLLLVPAHCPAPSSHCCALWGTRSSREGGTPGLYKAVTVGTGSRQTPPGELRHGKISFILSWTAAPGYSSSPFSAGKDRNLQQHSLSTYQGPFPTTPKPCPLDKSSLWTRTAMPRVPRAAHGAPRAALMVGAPPPPRNTSM